MRRKRRNVSLAYHRNDSLTAKRRRLSERFWLSFCFIAGNCKSSLAVRSSFPRSAFAVRAPPCSAVEMKSHQVSQRLLLNFPFIGLCRRRRDLSQVFPAELGLETEQGLSVRGERSVSAVVTQRLNPTRIIGFAGFAAILACNRRQPFGHADILINDFVAGAVEAERAEFSPSPAAQRIRYPADGGRP
jgi:hypothetical protein